MLPSCFVFFRAPRSRWLGFPFVVVNVLVVTDKVEANFSQFAFSEVADETSGGTEDVLASESPSDVETNFIDGVGG